ncbi:MAG: DUF502 domain-containing protein [Microcoleaceae cyanobacterium]
MWNITKLRKYLIEGVFALLPILLLFWVYSFIYRFISVTAQPIASHLFGGEGFTKNITVILLFLLLFICCGFLIKTPTGSYLYHALVTKLFHYLPGYSWINSTVAQFTEVDRNTFSSVAVVKVFPNETLMTAFITDEHEDGRKTVFVPTGPNPTSGNIYHLNSDQVFPINVPVEDAIRTIIGVGNGSRKLLKLYKQQYEKPQLLPQNPPHPDSNQVGNIPKDPRGKKVKNMSATILPESDNYSSETTLK